MRGKVALAVLATALALASIAEAEPVPGQEIAKRLFDEGLEAERNKDWMGAYAKFKESEQIKPTPGNRFHKAYCLEMTGKLASALDEYESADKLAQAEKKNDVREAIRVRYEPLVKRVPSLSVKTASIPKDAQFALDGNPIATVLLDGRAFRIEPGDHAVTARAPGFETFAKNFTLPDNTSTTTIEVVFVKEKPIVATKPPANGASGNTTLTEPPPEPAPSRSRTLPILTSVGAGVFLATGIVSFIVAGGAQSDAERDCPLKRSCDDEASKVRTFDTIALTGFIGAGALGALSVVLWTSSPSKSAGLKARPGWLGLEGAF